MKILKNKTAIITGATRGIGRGIAETFAKQGANVLFTYSSSSDLAKQIEKELSAEGVTVRGYKSDASSFEDCQKLVENISQEFDGFRLGAGYKHQIKDGLLIKPFLNYYEVDVTSSGTFVASSGSATATASISGTQGENWTEAGLGISYIINKFDVGLSYSKSVSDMDEVEDTDIISLNLSYNF